MLFLQKIKQAWIAALLMPVLFCSCATYNKRMTNYYTALENHQYKKAMSSLEKISLVKRNRNKLLYYFEKGRVYHLMQEYDSSNVYLNLADQFIENNRKTVGDIAKGYLINPMMQTYLGEDMERFMMHYYKGLNYFYSNQSAEAVVEARRIALAENAQSDKFGNKNNRYSKDAFALNLQGMLYEATGDINNAFIAYRNAADVYLNANGKYYGISLPQQLKQDVLRTAQQMGFIEEQQRYEKSFNTALQTDTASGGSLIVFVEKGIAPIKQEKNFYIAQNSDGLQGFYYINNTGDRIDIPFDYNYYSIDRSNASLQSFRSIRIALPYYAVRYTNHALVNIVANNSNYTTEPAQDLNNIAVNTLEERMLTEIANALARQLTKRLAEKAAEKTAEAASKNNSKEKDEDKKKQKAKEVGEAAGLLLNLVNTFTEKADTRNWQSLPAYIQYVRIPLQKGENTITLQNNGKAIAYNIQGNGGIQFLSQAIY